ncbi:Helix-turn-helix domain protein [Sporotomaculum syntrophicum]|uniref:Helix-turn-helix domain protein n=1 Tax=Sporotomaculum syntrophicum TaxID=182264 RepID=A0A9D3AVB3_9FIRM|nr:excisionase family DNA-binding protein [Sporotomaculum syntrophicum]KAF1083875.1 Helix-turn-helix domain protein [Sporotomaculum syntrophicum]
MLRDLQLKQDALNALDAPKATWPAKPSAKYVGISYWKLLELAKAGKIPHIRVGNRVLFRRESLDAWMAEQEAASIAKPEPVVATGKIRRLK